MVIQLPPNLPVGFRFHPTDVELVKSYLEPKILGRAYPDAIAEVDLCKLEPWELPSKSKIEMNNDRSWWFLCRRDYVNPSSGRAKRSTNTGFWKITGKERTIKDENTKVCIAKKRTLVFHTGPTPGRRTNWVMQEIYLNPDSFKIPAQMPAYVICRLKKKMDENVETPEGELVPNLEHLVSPLSAQSFCSVIPPGNLERQTDLDFDTALIESQLTEDDIRWMLSEGQNGSLGAAADSSEENPEDFADRCIVDYSEFFDDHYGTQATSKRSYYGEGPAGSDTDAEGANTLYFQTAEPSGYSYPNANSKKVRQMRMSMTQSKTVQMGGQHYEEEQTAAKPYPLVLQRGREEDFLDEQKVTLGKKSSSSSTSPTASITKPFACPRCNFQKQIQIQKSASSSSSPSSSSSTSTITKSTVKAEEPQKCVLRKQPCAIVKEYPDKGNLGEKGGSTSLTSSWLSVDSFVHNTSPSISGSRSPVEYWFNVVLGSFLFLIFVRELVIFGSW